jgi:hypothetical protein
MPPVRASKPSPGVDMKFRLLVPLACMFLLVNCTASPTLQPSPQPTSPASVTPSAVPTTPPTEAPTSTPNVLGLNIIAQFDPTRQILTIYGVTPGATVVMGGSPLPPPPTATATDTPAPTDTATATNTPSPRVFVPRPTRVPTAPITAASLQGKIIFKTARDGGAYPNAFAYYEMNPDGSDAQPLDFNATNALYRSLQSREGFSPDGSRVVLGERRCYGFGTCTLYILDAVLDAALINSNDDIGHGIWYYNKGFQAKEPVWSPSGNYIAFVSNHEADKGCIKTANIFKASPTQKPTVRRLTSGHDFCAGSATGHPSFSPDGSQLTFWGEGSGLNQIYVLDVGADDSFDFRVTNPHIISDHRSDDWDPLWVK